MKMGPVTPRQAVAAPGRAPNIHGEAPHDAGGTELPKTDKPRFSYLPWDVLASVVLGPFADGATKHGDRNWEQKPSSYMVHWEAAMRHLTAWVRGEEMTLDGDPPTHHLDNALARLLMLRAYTLRKIGKDDR